jgi:hypothetical protein
VASTALSPRSSPRSYLSIERRREKILEADHEARTILSTILYLAFVVVFDHEGGLCVHSAIGKRWHSLASEILAIPDVFMDTKVNGWPLL